MTIKANLVQSLNQNMELGSTVGSENIWPLEVDWSLTRNSQFILHNLTVLLFWFRSRDSVVGIATDYGLDDRGVGVWVPVGSRIFSSPTVQATSGVHPTSYTMGTGGSFLGVKQPGCEADHSPPTSAKVKKMWIYTSTPPYIFMA
jgi:hypothetical protein